ncbi:hypothetical protein BRD00_10865 [Halobacteriales archaeon QS_8_69_26]|nr:MAG: hypothetical protein BRD00_10865 [Halobacteriales archaeon QS_8_69_26]
MDVAVGEFVTPPPDSDLPDETYRVVGLPEGSATLLLVTVDGRRASTGKVVHVDRTTLSGFESAPDPGTGFDPLGWIRGEVAAIWHLLRWAFGR